jgi:hypothetical protein
VLACKSRSVSRNRWFKRPMKRRNSRTFQAIAERRFRLRGMPSREVVIRIGIPTRDGRDSRCPFQVIGLSNDAVQHAIGVDSLQALNLAFVGARNAVKNDIRVLSAFHKKLALTWENQPWDVSFPFWVCVFDAGQLSRVEKFVEGLYRGRRPVGRASRRRGRRAGHVIG